MYEGIDRLQKYQCATDIKNDILMSYNQILKNLKKVFIFGTKTLGLTAYNCCKKRGIQVVGFIDNNVKFQGQYIDKIQIYSLEQAVETNEDVWVIVASLTYWTQIEKQLKKSHIKKYIHYALLTLYDSQSFIAADKSLDNIVEDLIENKHKYIEIFNSVEDEISKLVMNNLLLFRMSFNTIYLVEAYKISNNYGNVYFDTNIIKLDEEEVFVDAGAYLGETSLNFIKQVSGRYKKIYIFEPDKDMLNIAIKNLENFKDIEFFEAGTGEKSEVLKFLKTGNMGGSITQYGTTEIEIVALDEVIKEKPTFIKLDVEGFEKETLLGAKKLITQNRPKLAISVYHKPADFWELYEFTKGLVGDYKVYVRHYTEVCFDTDLYFI